MYALRSIRTQFPRNTRYLSTTFASRMPEGTNQSHATDPQQGSVVPEKVQEKLPKGVEQAVPDTVHDTSSSQDHSTGHSYVPKSIAEALPKK
ncbi:hypothetical protein LTR53_018850, partial [Teratosphaeriaceae sp. CCFEE 6253]